MKIVICYRNKMDVQPLGIEAPLDIVNLTRTLISSGSDLYISELYMIPGHHGGSLALPILPLSVHHFLGK